MFYRPANQYSCKPICKKIKRRHGSGQDKDQRKKSSKKHSHLFTHSHKKLPSFMATKAEEKIFDFGKTN